MQEQRQLKRWHLVYYLRIFDQETESFLGHVVDVSTEGLKVVSEWPIPTKKAYQLWMEIPREGSEEARTVLHGYSLWSHQDENPGFYNTGFRLVNPSQATTESIRRLVNELQIQD